MISTDFSQAKRVRSITRPLVTIPEMHNIRTMPIFGAPECFTGKPYNGFYADIWSL